MKAIYPKESCPRLTKYDGTHYIMYLGGKAVKYRPIGEGEESEERDGVEYEGNMSDGGTLIECNEWQRDKLIGGIIRSKYLQTEEDAIKTHQIQVLQSLSGGDKLSDKKKAEYQSEWKEFQAFRTLAIDYVDSLDNWQK